MDVAPGLIRLAEELPASEEMGLSYQIRNLIVEVPAAIASDMMRGTDLRFTAAMRLVATIDLIDRVYPALDTAATRQAVDQLAEHLTGTGFRDETNAQQAPQPPAMPTPAPERESDEPAAEPSQVPVLEVDTHTEATHVTVEPQPTETPHVHPNSVQ
jgi:hypothetical protein